MRNRQWLWVLALPVLAAFTWSGAQRATTGVPSEQQQTSIEVTNDNWNTVNVYVMRAGQAVRLGMVETASTGHFRMPPDFENASGQVELLVDPIGGFHAYVSDALVFSPGDTIKLDVMNDLALSSLSVHPA
jgi:hypothetical protein